MKAIKIYLIVVTVLLIIAIGFGIYVWFIVQSLGTDAPQSGEQKVQNTSTQSISENTVPQSNGSEPIVIDRSELSENQQKVLDTVGIDGETFVITQAMIECAESEIGAERLDEIVAGSIPGPLESLALLRCSKQ